MDPIPEDIKTSANKIFSKHSRYEVKKWASNLNDHYQLLIASEKPLNLDYARPFSNTNDLARNVPEVSHGVAAEKQKLEQERDEFIKKAGNFKEIYADEQDQQKMSYNEKKLYQEKQQINFHYERHHAVGFLLRKMPHNYAIYKRVMTELESRDPNFEPQSLLDFGAGLGSGAWAGIH